MKPPSHPTRSHVGDRLKRPDQKVRADADFGPPPVPLLNPKGQTGQTGVADVCLDWREGVPGLGESPANDGAAVREADGGPALTGCVLVVAVQLQDDVGLFCLSTAAKDEHVMEVET